MGLATTALKRLFDRNAGQAACLPIFGDELIPFAERYPMVVPPKLDRETEDEMRRRKKTQLDRDAAAAREAG